MHAQRPIVLSTGALIAIIAACSAPTQLAGSAAPAGRDCFNVQFLTGYDTVDRDTLRVRSGPSSAYDIDIAGGQCSEIDWAHRVAIESTPSSWICVGNQPGQGSIAFRDPTTRRGTECYIEAVRRAPEPERHSLRKHQSGG